MDKSLSLEALHSIATPADDSLNLNDQSTDTSRTKTKNENSLGRQGDKISGGGNEFMRVLYCTNLDKSFDYEKLYDSLKPFGIIERIKLKLSSDNRFYDAFITFKENASAICAVTSIKDGDLALGYRPKLLDFRNVLDEDLDFVPNLFDEPEIAPIRREAPIMTWHVATYKDGRSNFIKAAESLQKKIGNIPQGNLKKYGPNLLIKAGNLTQASLLTNYRPSNEGNIDRITPHKSFNVKKGVIYCRDLYEFSEDQILERCPPNVYEVRKLNGNNGAILLTFTSYYLPDSITIRHLNIKVKKFKTRPNQCFRCYEYGHPATKCNNNNKCYICSGEHEDGDECSTNAFCFHCGGDHSPNSKICPRYNFEVEVLETANNEYISIGSAKRKLMTANQSPDATYARVVRNLKSKRNVSGKNSNGKTKPEQRKARASSPIARKNGPQNNPQSKAQKASINEKPLADENEVNLEGAVADNLDDVSTSESLPDLMDVESTDAAKKVQHKQLSEKETNVNVEDKKGKTTSLEIPSPMITVASKEKVEDFQTVTGRKHKGSLSPKKDSHDIQLSNSFALLDEHHQVKKKVTSERSVKVSNPSSQKTKSSTFVERDSKDKVPSKAIVQQSDKSKSKSDQEQKKKEIYKENFLLTEVKSSKPSQLAGGKKS